MRVAVHKIVTALSAAIGPVLREHNKFDDIVPAMAVLTARIAQGRPIGDDPFKALDEMHKLAKDALTQFIQLENEKAAQDQKQLEQATAGNADTPTEESRIIPITAAGAIALQRAKAEEEEIEEVPNDGKIILPP